MSGTAASNEVIAAIRYAVGWRIAITDDAFDRLYPEPVRAMSAVHWTPVRVALRASSWLAPEPGMRVLDVGSGAGKLCCIGALATPSRWVGVEREPALVDAAAELATRLELADRARFTCDDMAAIQWKDFDSLYFYNPFEMVLYDTIPSELPHRWTLFGNELERVTAALADMPSGTRVVTYHGFGGDMPAGYVLVEAEHSRHGSARALGQADAGPAAVPRDAGPVPRRIAVTRVIIVAPADARWPDRARSVLADARLFGARLYEPSLLPLLVRSGGVRAVAIDIRTRLRSGAVLRECMAADPAVELVLIHEGQLPVTLGTWHSHAWPEEPAAMLALVATR